jgi:hypothetical protein
MKYEVFGRVRDASHELEVRILLPESVGKMLNARNGLCLPTVVDKLVLGVDG